jgi:flagellar hook-associated protein 2
MASISSPGIGSGLDIAGIVNKLVAAEGQPTANRLDRKEANLQARLSAYGTLKGALATLQSKLDNLGKLATFQSRSASSSNQTAFTVTASSDAAAANYNVSIADLAASQTLTTDPLAAFSSTTAAVGTGSLTFRFGTTVSSPYGFTQNTDKGTFTIDIDATNNSLEGIAKAVNEADIGVRASIINNGSGYLLAFSSTDTGAKNSMEITVNDSGDGNNTDANGLSNLAFNSAATNLQQTVAAQDASLTIDGVSVTSATNTVTGAIAGVTLNLLAAGNGTANVSLDKGSVTRAVNDFVSSYNSLVKTIDSVAGYDAKTKRGGPLNGDAGILAIQGGLRRLLSTAVTGASGTYSSLTGLGIATQNDGSLSVDSSKLQTALDSHFNDLASLFAAVGQPSDSLIKYVSSTSSTAVGNYAVDITQLATQGSILGNTTGVLANTGGTFTTPFVIDGNNDTFAVQVDGIQSGTISLTQKTYTTASELVAEIQTRINGDPALSAAAVAVNVTFDNATAKFKITSNRYGSASDVQFTSVGTNTASTLGFDTTLTPTTGQDVAGSIGGATASGSGQHLTGMGDAAGLKLEVTGGLIGARGSDGRVDSVNKSIADIQKQRDDLSRRLDSLQKRYEKQFNALDALLSQMNATSTFLNQQLANLPKIGGSSSSN